MHEKHADEKEVSDGISEDSEIDPEDDGKRPVGSTSQHCLGNIQGLWAEPK